MRLEEHPTVRNHRAQTRPPQVLDTRWLRELCLAAGADDVGFVALDRPELADQREFIRAALPGVRSLISLVVRMNREPLRSPARSAANLEFHHARDEADEVAHKIVRQLEDAGIPALNPATAFPMEMDLFPGRIWVVSHKPVAVAAGLGRMGIHRNVIHPRFGNFILLGTILVAADLDSEGSPLDYNPCLECKLCVAACPVGAIGADGYFDFSACSTHNYREFMTGFEDYVGKVADSSSAADLRENVPLAETVSMWQSLSYGANYKAAYCLSVCPAGEDVIGPFLEDRKGFQDRILRPLQQKAEPVYVVSGSDAEEHVSRRFPHKTPKRVRRSLRASSVAAFLRALPLVFQRGKAQGLDVTYHFKFTGEESAEATVRIANKTVSVEPGLQGECQLRVEADSRTWLGFVDRRRSLAWALLRGRIRLTGPPRLLVAFGKCFR